MIPRLNLLFLESTNKLAKVHHISIKIGDDIIENVPAVHNLGMYFDSELKHTVHINKLASSSFATLQNVAHIRNHLDIPTTKTTHPGTCHQ